MTFDEFIWHNCAGPCPCPDCAAYIEAERETPTPMTLREKYLSDRKRRKHGDKIQDNTSDSNTPATTPAFDLGVGHFAADIPDTTPEAPAEAPADCGTPDVPCDFGGGGGGE